MTSQPVLPSRKKVAAALLLSASTTLLVAWSIATAIGSWQANHAVGNYWLLPINNTRFWFLLLFAGAVPAVAWWGGRRSTWASVALGSMALAACLSVGYWFNVARSLPVGVTREDALRAQDEEVVASSLVGALTLFAIVSLGLGIRDTLSDVRELRPLVPHP